MMDFISTDTLALLWFLAIGLSVALYILLDGGDLGLGIISLFERNEAERSTIMGMLGPIWDANETWLVIAGGMLFGAFPTVYGIVLSALYIPVMIMLFGLILRAVSFEFHAIGHAKGLWSFMFGFGSVLAGVGQGLGVGGILSGILVTNNEFAGGAFDFLTPLTLLITIGVAMSYVFVGYAYLIKKTGKETAPGTYLRILMLGGVTGVSLLGATLLLPQKSYLFFTRWTMYPTNILLFVDVAVMGALSLWLIWLAWKQDHGPALHNLCLAIFVCSMLGMLIGIYPYIIPPTVTIFDAHSSRATLEFMLVGLGPLFPIVLVYNFYLHRVFRGTTHSKADTYGS